MEKTSAASVIAETRLNKYTTNKRMPDRGGRTTEMDAPAPEMPAWQKNRAPMPQRGQHVGGGSGRNVRGGGGNDGRRGTFVFHFLISVFCCIGRADDRRRQPQNIDAGGHYANGGGQQHGGGQKHFQQQPQHQQTAFGNPAYGVSRVFCFCIFTVPFMQSPSTQLFGDASRHYQPQYVPQPQRSNDTGYYQGPPQQQDQMFYNNQQRGGGGHRGGGGPRGGGGGRW